MSYESVKAFMGKYGIQNQKLTEMQNRLDELEDQSTRVIGKKLDGMPRADVGIRDRTGENASKIFDLEREIERQAEVVQKLRKKTERIIERIPDSSPCVIHSKSVLRYRYIDGYRWNKINWLLFGGMADFNDREDSYFRRTTKAHGRGLKKLSEIMEGFDETNS